MKNKTEHGKRSVKRTASKSHDIDVEIHAIKDGIKDVNREIHTKTSFALIWLVMTLLIVSMLVTTVGVFYMTLPSEINANKTIPEPAKTEHVRSEPYYGVMLNSFMTKHPAYIPGEEATVEANILANSSIETRTTYTLKDSSEKDLYYFTGNHTINGQKTLTKNILLTENYPPGKYDVEINSRFKVNGQRYVLTGMTSFWIKEKERPNYVALVGKSISGMEPLEHTLMIAIIILNLVLVYNMWNMENEKRKGEG